jgi:GNAT superfamily N-acetyltransferase
MVQIVLPALIPDIRRIYDVYFAAFEADPMGRILLKILFPNIDDENFREAHAAGTLQWWHASENQYTWKCLDTDTGEIVGMGLGDLFSKYRTPEERQNFGVTWLEGEQRERAEKVINPLWEMREKLFGGQPYIYCHVIAVDPKYQGRKAGMLLCQWGLHMGEATGLPVYFESSPSTVNLYKKAGFELLSEKIVHKAETLGTPTDIEVPLMVKMPSVAAGMTFEEWRRNGYPAFGKRQPVEQPKEQGPAVEVVEIPAPSQGVA